MIPDTDKFFLDKLDCAQYNGVKHKWRSNDGLVNEISAGAPFGAPEKKYVGGEKLMPGFWYVMPTFRGDHMSLQGGLTKRINIKPFYLELANMISEL